MLTAMFAALAVLTPLGFEAPASRSVARLGTHAGGEVSANATKTALRAPPNLWGTEFAAHGLRAQASSATTGAAPAHNELRRCAAQKTEGAGKSASGPGCGKGAKTAGDANPGSKEMMLKRKDHKCGNCLQTWGSAAQKPLHRPCRQQVGCGRCAQDCPACIAA